MLSVMHAASPGAIAGALGHSHLEIRPLEIRPDYLAQSLGYNSNLALIESDNCDCCFDFMIVNKITNLLIFSPPADNLTGEHGVPIALR